MTKVKLMIGIEGAPSYLWPSGFLWSVPPPEDLVAVTTSGTISVNWVWRATGDLK